MPSKKTVQTSKNAIRNAAIFFQLLSSASRLAAVVELADGSRTTSQLAKAAKQTLCAMSHDLALMRKAKIVTKKEVGRNSLYSLAVDEKIRGLVMSVVSR